MVFISYSKAEAELKEQRHEQMFYKYSSKLEFYKLEEMLKKSYVYSPFLYNQGKRLKDLIISEAYFVVIDVDTGAKTLHEQHQELKDEGINHIIGTTSDKTRLNKFRVLIPLNRGVCPKAYTEVITGIIEYAVIINIDEASKKPSQTFYSYKDATVLTYFEGESLEVDTYTIKTTRQKSTGTPLKDCSDFVRSYNNPRAQKGTDALVSASYGMQRANFNRFQYEECIKEINANWFYPMNINLLYGTVINPLTRKLFN